jgi:hypothetical protein
MAGVAKLLRLLSESISVEGQPLWSDFRAKTSAAIKKVALGARVIWATTQKGFKTEVLKPF